MDNPIVTVKPAEMDPTCSVIVVNERFYKIPKVVLEYIDELELICRDEGYKV